MTGNEKLAGCRNVVGKAVVLLSCWSGQIPGEAEVEDEANVRVVVVVVMIVFVIFFLPSAERDEVVAEEEEEEEEVEVGTPGRLSSTGSCWSSAVLPWLMGITDCETDDRLEDED